MKLRLYNICLYAQKNNIYYRNENNTTKQKTICSNICNNVCRNYSYGVGTINWLNYIKNNFPEYELEVVDELFISKYIENRLIK